MSDNKLNIAIGSMVQAGEMLANKALEIVDDLNLNKTVAQPVAEEHIHELQFLALEWGSKCDDFKALLGIDIEDEEDE